VLYTQTADWAGYQGEHHIVNLPLRYNHCVRSIIYGRSRPSLPWRK